MGVLRAKAAIEALSCGGGSGLTSSGSSSLQSEVSSSLSSLPVLGEENKTTLSRALMGVVGSEHVRVVMPVILQLLPLLDFLQLLLGPFKLHSLLLVGVVTNLVGDL